MSIPQLNTTKVHRPWSRLIILVIFFVSLALGGQTQAFAATAQPVEPVHSSSMFQPVMQAQPSLLAGLSGDFGALDQGHLSGALGPTTSLIHAPTAITQKGTLILNGEKDLLSAVIDPVKGFAYFGTNTAPGIIVKVRLSDFTRVGALSLNVGEDNLTSAVIDTGNGFAYFGTNTSPGIVVKVRLSDFTRVGARALNVGENSLTSAVIDPFNRFAYFGTNTAPGIVVKVDLSTFTRAGALPLNTGEDSLSAAVIDAAKGFAFFGTNTSPAIVVRLNLTSFLRVDAVPLSDGSVTSLEADLTAAVIDPVHFAAYFTTNTNILVRVDTSASNFVRSDAIQLSSPTGSAKLQSAVIDLSGAGFGIGYFGGGVDSGNGFVDKVDLATFKQVGPPVELTSELNVRSAVLDPTTSLAYFGTAGSDPSGVVRLDVSPVNFARLDAITLPIAALNFWAGVIDPVAGFAYFGTYAQPAVIAKVRLSDFTRVTTLQLNPGENGIRSAVIDTTHGFAYFGTYQGTVVQVDLKTFTRVGAVTLASPAGLTSAVIDTANGFAYFGTDTSPGQVVKVSLAPSPFQIVTAETVTLNTGENDLESAVIDPANHLAYFGTMGPGGVVKMDVKPAALARIGAATTDPTLNLGNFTSAVINLTTKLAYFGTHTIPGNVVTFDINPANTFKKVGSANLTASNLTSAVINPGAGLAFFGSQEAPGTVVQVTLAMTPTQSDQLRLGANENFLTSAVIDTAQGCAYFGAGDSFLDTFNNNYTPPFESRRIMKLAVGGCKEPTTTVIGFHLPNPSNVGQAVVVNYTVSSPAGTPTGSVMVSDGTVSCTGTVAAGACTLTPTSAGNKTLTATYAGDATFNSSSDTAAHTVNAVAKPTTTTTITSHTPNPSIVGQAITVTFSVTSSGGTPTGNVTVNDGSVTCIATVAAGSCKLTPTSPGAKTLTALYPANAAFAGSSGTAAHTVNPAGKAPSTTTITSHNPNPSVVGQAVVILFSVTGPAGAPTGVITVTDSLVSCSAILGTGFCTLTPTTAGAKTLTATYGGDANFDGSSDTAPHMVNTSGTAKYKNFFPLSIKQSQ